MTAQEPLTHRQVLDAIAAGLRLPDASTDQTARVNPGERAAALMIALLLCCEVHTGLRPHRLSASVNGTFVATFLTGGDAYAIIEVDTSPTEYDEPPAIVCCSKGEGRPFAHDLYFADGLQGDSLRAMVKWLRSQGASE